MKDLTKGNIYKNFALFTLPLILSALLSQGYNLIDTVIAGKYLGQNGLGAIGATAAFITFISCPVWGFGTGLGMYLAKLFGGKEFSKLRKAVITDLIILFSAVLFFSLLLILLREPLADLLKIDREIRKDALKYFAVYMAGFAPIVLGTAFVQVFNSLGNSSVSFFLSLTSAVLNVTGNILSVAVFGAGVFGIALSSVIAAVITDIIYAVILRSCFIKLGVSGEKLSFSAKLVTETLAYSGPTSLQQSVMYASSLLVSPVVNGLGAAATAGYAVILKIYDFNAVIYQNASETFSYFSAQCIGGKKYSQIRKGLLTALITGIAFVLPTVLVFMLFSGDICSLFYPEGFTGEAMDYCLRFTRVYLPFIFFNLINNLFHSFCRGTGNMKNLLLSTFIGSVSRVLITFVLSAPLGMEGVFIGFVGSFICEAVLSASVLILTCRTEKTLEAKILASSVKKT